MTVSHQRHAYTVRFHSKDGLGNVSDSVNQTLSNVDDYSIVKGGPIKNYKRLISLGLFAGTTLNASARFRRTVDVFVAGYHGAEPGFPALNYALSEARGMPDFLPGNALSDPSLSNADTAALTRLAQRISDTQTTFQGGVFVGEIREAIHLVRHPLSSIQQALVGHLKLVAKRAKRIRHVRVMKKMVSQSWLELQFGIKPLLADIDDGAKALAEFVNDDRRREFKTLNAFGSDETANNQSNVLCTSASGYALAYANVRRHKTTTVKYLVCLGVTPSVRSCAFGKFGISFSNFVPTLWELIPFSFVADYFTNIGDVIQGLANITVNPRWVMRWVITEDKEEATNFNLGSSVNPHITQVCSGGYSSVVTRSVSRAPFVGSLVPDFRFEVPGMSSLKWANLAALSAQLALTRRVVQTPAKNKLFLLRKGTF